MINGSESNTSPNSDFGTSSKEADEIQNCFAVANISEDKAIRMALINKGLDLAIAKIVEHLGSSLILMIPAFKVSYF